MRFIRTTDIVDVNTLTDDASAVYVDPGGVGPEHMLKQDDLLFSRSGTLGRCLRYQQPRVASTFAGYLVRFRPRTDLASPRYLAYCAQANFFQEAIAADAISSTISNFNAEKYAEIRLPWWPVSTQDAIADFLDRETARIDALIAAKRRMIELLEVQDLSLAHSAITGTLITGERVPSGSPWLGSLPRGWGLAPVSSQFEVTLGRMLNAERAANGDMRRYVRNINVRWDRVDVGDLAEMDFPASERSRYRLRYGDLLINEGGAGVGRSAIWRDEVDECYFQKSVLRLRSTGHSSVEWMVECMRVAVAQKVPLVEGNLATIPHVPAEALRVWRLPFPPADVQHALLTWLRERRDHALRMREVTQRQISLLVERRQALITAAVTGTIEVGVAA